MVAVGWAAGLALVLAVPAGAVELQVSAPALERTLQHQVFTSPGPDGKPSRHYLRGDPTKPCSVYVDNAHLSFRHMVPPVVTNPPVGSAGVDAPGAPVLPPTPPPDMPVAEDRIVVSVTTHAKFGKAVKGFCLGIPITIESQVSFVPEAEGESIGFRDARIDHASNNAELNALLEPFLARRLPSELKVNAANLLRTLLVRSPDSTGYTVTLLALDIKTMRVADQVLLVDLDASMKVE